MRKRATASPKAWSILDGSRLSPPVKRWQAQLDSAMRSLCRPSPETLLAEDWDFRTVQESEMIAAITYEYLRESVPIRKAIMKWLDTRIEGESVRVLLVEKGLSGLPQPVQEQFVRLFQSVGQHVIKWLHLLIAFPRFPLAWLANDAFERRRFSDFLFGSDERKMKIAPIADKSVYSAYGSYPDLNLDLTHAENAPIGKEAEPTCFGNHGFFGVGETRSYLLRLHFCESFGVKDVLREFEQWLTPVRAFAPRQDVCSCGR